MTGDQSFYSRQRAEMRWQIVARAVSRRARQAFGSSDSRWRPPSGGCSNTVPACRVPHLRRLAIEQAPRCSGGCRILTQVLITTHGIRDIPEELGKKNSNRTHTLRTVPIARFQRFTCKLLKCRMRHYRAGRRIDMLANRRKAERRLCRRVAKIQFGNSSLPRDCTITDVSDGGVKLIAEYLDIPTEFTIILSTGNPRQCRLAWRIGCELGAEFID